MNLILASQSPRRRQLLAGLNIPYICEDINADESYPADLSPEEISKYIAKKKADAYKKNLDKNILITCDTIVAIHRKILGKPANENNAIDILRTLSDNMHEVWTGVCIKNKNTEKIFAELTKVYFRKLSDDEIFHYIKTFKPLDKAGAYGIQEWIGYIGVTRIEGCYYNVMGLPLSRLYSELQTFF